MSKEKKLVPKLRFPEFTGEWENKKLGEISEYTKGFAFKSSEYRNNGVRIIRVSDLGKDKVKTNNEQVFIDKRKIDVYRKYNILKGNIIITTVGSDPELIESAVGRGIFINSNHLGLLNQNMLKIDNLKKINNRFLFSYINTPKYIAYIKSIKRGNANQANITVKDLFDYKVKITSLKEQEKIASFLLKVDEKLEKLEKKKELWEKYKKGVMQKIFSQEIRFKNDDGKDFPDWEEKRLEEIGKFLKGKGISKIDITEDGIECIRYGELYTTYNEVIKNVVSKTNVTMDELILSKANDIIIPSSGESSLDISTASCVTRGNIALGGDINIIRSKENGVFLAYYLNNAKKKDIARLSQGISVIHLYNSQLKDLKIKLPYILEQEKISDFLSSLDRKIEILEKEIEKNKEFKKGLLQQLFC